MSVQQPGPPFHRSVSPAAPGTPGAPGTPSSAGMPPANLPPTGGPPYGHGPVVPATNGAATASLVLGIVSLVASLLFLPAILGMVFGFVGVNRAGRTNPPVGKGKAITGIVLSAVGLLLGIGLVNLIGTASDDAGAPAQDAVVQEDPARDVDESADDDGADAADGDQKKDAEKADESAKEKPAKEAPEETVSQENARESAENYLQFTAFSKTGLVDQLEFEGFSSADAEYAVEHIEVDWMRQAEKSAEDYMEFSAFSRSGLIDQLTFEGFTPEQAAHGADSVGL